MDEIGSNESRAARNQYFFHSVIPRMCDLFSDSILIKNELTIRAETLADAVNL
jgi:hypothetical protein